MLTNEIEKKSTGNKNNNGEERRAPLKTAADLQRLKLEKLMKNPEKPVIIPERPKEKGLASAPDFVRNVMGSSAGAGSGEFHVYRHLRRKEYARQKFIQAKGQKELLDDKYHEKLEENKRIADEKTAKKRAKRLKKKQKMKNKPKKPKLENTTTQSNQESEEETEDDSDDYKKEESENDNKEESDINDKKEESENNDKKEEAENSGKKEEAENSDKNEESESNSKKEDLKNINEKKDSENIG